MNLPRFVTKPHTWNNPSSWESLCNALPSGTLGFWNRAGRAAWETGGWALPVLSGKSISSLWCLRPEGGHCCIWSVWGVSTSQMWSSSSLCCLFGHIQFISVQFSSVQFCQSGDCVLCSLLIWVILLTLGIREVSKCEYTCFFTGRLTSLMCWHWQISLFVMQTHRTFSSPTYFTYLRYSSPCPCLYNIDHSYAFKWKMMP